MRTPKEILEQSSVIAVVGASRDPGKSAYSVPQQMQLHGWRIMPVNPFADELFGEPVYRTLAEVPVPIDVVDVFRPSEDAPDVARQAAAVGAKALWLQQGIVSEEARRIAEAAGMDYVEDLCIAVARAIFQVTKPAG
jgi:uncharacterized protein